MKTLISKIEKLVKSLSKADDYELNIKYLDQYDCRFAQNAISQHLAGKNLTITYTAYINKKSASSTINQYDEQEINSLVKRTEESALLNQPDPEFCPSLSALKFKEFNNTKPDTLNLTPQKAVDTIKKAIAMANKKDCLLSGIFSKEYYIEHLSTKNGFSGFYDACDYDYSMTIKKEARETKISVSEVDFAKFNLENTFEKLYNQFSALDTPKTMEPETLPVILRPAAVSNLMMYLLWILDRRMADDGITPFTNQLGIKFFGEKFNLFTSSNDPDLIIKPFNNSSIFEDIEWIKNGVLQQMPMSKSYANKIHAKANSIFNAIIPGEDVSEEDMMIQAGRGLIINNFWYIRPNDMKTADFTGMTRDGVLYFENGKVKYAVNNFRFNVGLVEVTRNIMSLGKSEICGHNFKMPTMLISDFNFVDKTNF